MVIIYHYVHQNFLKQYLIIEIDWDPHTQLYSLIYSRLNLYLIFIFFCFFTSLNYFLLIVMNLLLFFDFFIYGRFLNNLFFS